jgi:hypothetical protein
MINIKQPLHIWNRLWVKTHRNAEHLFLTLTGRLFACITAGAKSPTPMDPGRNMKYQRVAAIATAVAPGHNVNVSGVRGHSQFALRAERKMRGRYPAGNLNNT